VRVLRDPFYRAVNHLTRSNPIERRSNIWFQFEAKGERSSNLIRIGYVVLWFTCTVVHAPGNAYWSNVANLGVGGIWLAWCIGFQWYLLKRPYRKSFKYLSTTMDMLVISAMLFIYQYAGGPAYALKVPTYLNYFCCMGLAAMRYRMHLAVYAGVAAVIGYLGNCLWFWHVYHFATGTGLEHTTSAKISISYLGFTVLYLIVFTMLIYTLMYNVKRLVNVRVREGEAALKAKERAAIAANVAHEIKNPLEGIYGAAQILQEEGKGNPKFIGMILKDSVRLNGVVQQFLQFSRPFQARMADFDLVEAASAFCREQASLSEEGAVDFRADLDAARVSADQEGLRQILLNLYQNARRYQVAGKPVAVRVRAGEGCTELAVEDDGEGIPQANRNKVFDPFFTTSSKGTGLGLAISRKIAQEMGGDLYYEPKVPGTRFVLALKPAKPAENAA
jgi:signal transduction histidine kinase